MPFTASVVGRATTSASTTSLALRTSGVVAAGSKLYCIVVIDKSGFTDVTDTGGNTYGQIAASQSGLGAFVMYVDSSVRLGNNSTITLTNSTAFAATMAAIAISNFDDGTADASSAGQGASVSPLVGLDNVPVNDWCVGIAAVAGGSADGFTQDPLFTDIGNFNTQVTTVLSSYSGVYQAKAGGSVMYRPTLGVARTWAALMVSIKP